MVADIGIFYDASTYAVRAVAGTQAIICMLLLRMRGGFACGMPAGAEQCKEDAAARRRDTRSNA